MARRLVERERPIILMYHRVARVACDPWQLAVSPERFAVQIEALVQERRVVPLRWLVEELTQGRAPRKVAAVTFDDGYADVLTEAKPVLERQGCAATVFLTTGAIGNSQEFWWDELSRLVLESPALPSTLEIEIAGRLHRWWLEGASAGNPSAKDGDAGWSTRMELHLALWRLLRPLDPALRRRHLDALAAWAGANTGARPEFRALTADEVHRLADPGFIDIGAHTVTHPSMPSLDPTGRRAEVAESKRVCEELTGARIDGFAYPFGDLDDVSIAAVREAGFTFACSTEHAVVTTRSDPLRLPRLAVGDWGAAQFVRWLAWDGRSP